MAFHGSADRLRGIKKSVWVEFTQLALDYNPVNLGHGFPDCAVPEHVRQALSDATLSSNLLLNQYTRGYGHPRLINALAKLYSKLVDRPINPQTEVVVTIGAYGALYCTIFGLVNPGDEVIIIEPFYDCYKPMTCMAGGVPVFIPLRPRNSSGVMTSGDWVLDPKELESKFNDKTKLIIVNTPQNPIGKVFTREELEMIGNLCKKHDVIAVMDEVYEWIVYKGSEHTKMATLPDMWERTITIGSAGKTFSATGWKLGWAYGPEHLIQSLQFLHQNCNNTCPTPIQEAVAVGIEIETDRFDKPDSYWKNLSQNLEFKRNKLVKILSDVGMEPIVPEGGYFILANFTNLESKIDTSSEIGTRDFRFAKWLSKNKNLQGIPPSAFYSEENKKLAENLIRFCFFKKDVTLDKAAEILGNLKKTLKN